MALKDSLGKPTIKLNSFKDFREFVCKPLVQDPNGVKIDEKGRRVLIFIVEKKKPQLSNSNSTSTTTTPRGSVVSPSTPRSVQTDSPSTTNTTEEEGKGSVVTDYSPLSTGGKNAFEKLSKRFELPGGVEKSGYHTSYSTTTTTTTTSRSKGGEDKEKESWGTVKGMLENFVKDLNLHLADTFGDEAGNFRLKTHQDDEDDDDGVTVVKEKKEKEEEIKTIPVQVKALHPHVFCDRCL